MRIPTRIPEADSYGIVLVVLFGLASFSLAAHLYSRLLQTRKVEFMRVYCVVMAFVFGFAMVVFRAEPIIGDSIIRWLLALPIGLIVGVVCTWSDRRLVRYLVRRRRFSIRSLPGRSSPWTTSTHKETHSVVRIRPVSVLADSPRTRLINPGGRSVVPRADRTTRSSWHLVIAIAVLEELIFRGVLVQASFLLSNVVVCAAALIATVIVFALAHVAFGWAHVIGKLPLGVGALISVLAMGTIVPAILAHGYFNYRVWREQSDVPKIVTTQ